MIGNLLLCFSAILGEFEVNFSNKKGFRLAWIGYIIGTITDSVRGRLASEKEDKSDGNDEEIFSEF